MDRVLQVILRSYIRRGTLRLTTARGTTLEFGDGTGTPVAVRFTCAAAEWAVLLDPELARRRNLHERHTGDRARLDRGLPRAGDLATSAQLAAQSLGASPQWLLRYLWSALRAIEHPAHALAQQRRASLRLDERLYALFLDADRQYTCAYFEHRRSSRSTRRKLAKKTSHRGQAAARRPGARVLDIGSGWGGLGALSRRDRAARGHRRHALGGAVRARAQARRRKGLAARVEFRLQDYRDIDGDVRPHRIGRHVRACRRQAYYDAFFRKCAGTARRRRRDAAAFDRPLGRPGRSPIRGSRSTSSPAATSRRSRRCCPRSSAPDCWSPTSRFCGCTTPRRCEHWRERLPRASLEVLKILPAIRR